MFRTVIVGLAVMVWSQVARAETPAVVEQWLAAQNAGKFADYEALYAKTFQGVRRSGAKITRLDREGWMRDRKRMFSARIKVAIDNVVVETVDDTTRVKFTQTFESGTYKDVGEKVLDIIGGQIVREEMVTSAKAADRACSADRCKDASNPAAIVASCEASCAASDGNACGVLRDMYSSGACGVKSDMAKALKRGEQACNLGALDQCYWPALEYTATDPVKAIGLYRRCCVNDDLPCCYGLGTLLVNNKDVKHGLPLLEKICLEYDRSAQGPGACKKLEDMYRYGRGVKRNLEKAREYRHLYENAIGGE